MKWHDRTAVMKNIPFEKQTPVAGYVDSTNRWVVQVFAVDTVVDTPWEGMVRVGIKFHSRTQKGLEIEQRWSVLQEIKEDLFPGRLAIEVYPPEAQVVDVAPMRWLWVFPAGCQLPISLSGMRDHVG